MSSYRRRLLLANQLEENLYLYGNSVQDGTPTPEAPIDIVSVENPTIKITGKNLLNPSSLKTTTNSFTFDASVGDGSIIINGIGDNTSYSIRSLRSGVSFDNMLKDGETYTFAMDVSEQKVINLIVRATKLSNNSDVYYQASKANNYCSSFTVDKSTYKYQELYIQINPTSAVYENVVIKPIFALGDYTELPFEPYEEEIITINQNTPFGKNLLKPEKFTTVVKECITFNSIGDGSITVNGTPNSTLSLNLKSEEELEKLLIDGEKYTLALNPSVKNMSIALMIQRRNKSSNAISYISANRYNSYTVTDQIDKNKYQYQKLYLQITITDPVQLYDNMIVQPMISLSEYAIPFEQYVPPITTMRGIGDYKDRIYTKDGKVWFEQQVKHFLRDKFPGADENSATIVQLSGANTPLVRDSGYQYVVTQNQMSNIGAYQITHSKNGNLHWYIAKNGAYMIPPDAETWTNATNAYEYYANISNNTPMEFQYPLATPIMTEITGPLAEKILAIDKTKNITITSENGVSGTVEVIEE